MELQLVTKDGKSASNLSVDETVFGADFNESLIHQSVTAFLAGARQGTRAQKTRSDVRGGGAKPWRQKGTGRARAGTIRSPLWRSGGMIFAARPQDFSQKVNRKAHRAAMRSIFSELNRADRLSVLEVLGDQSPKTKSFVAWLDATLGQRDEIKSVLLISNEFDRDLWLAARNVPNVSVIEVSEINPVYLISHDRVLVSSEAISKIEENLK